MKDQYFGDVNDYRNYGPLPALQSQGNGSLLVAWMLTLDDGGRDGGRRSPDRLAVVVAITGPTAPHRRQQPRRS